MTSYIPLDPRLFSAAPRSVGGWQSQAQRDAEAAVLMAEQAAEQAAAKAARLAAKDALAEAEEVEVPFDSARGAGPAAASGAGGAASLAPLPQAGGGEAELPEVLPLDGGGLGGGDGASPPIVAGRRESTPPPTPPHQGEGRSRDSAEICGSDDDEFYDYDYDDEEEFEPEPEEEPDPELIGWAPPPRKVQCPRKREWDRQKMALFLRELAASQSVSQAAKAVGMSRQSAYKLRARLVSTPFALGWEVALEAGLGQLAHAMLDRAVNGVEVPHYYKGEVVGTSRHYDERLAIWLMSNPWKVGRQQIAREFSAEGFDRLIERIEYGPLEWGDAEQARGAVDQLPGMLPPARTADGANRQQDNFMIRSWYGAGAGDPPRRAGRGR